jgi:diguanylate cyclase (GGDEF)-like protein/PAS domain S-box-containing protein
VTQLFKTQKDAATLPKPEGLPVLRVPRFSIQNLSITSKLSLMVVSLMTASLGMLVGALGSFEVSAGVRAYVTAESLYSKGQKDAIYFLVRYVRSRSEVDYQRYLDAISIPLGDQKARLELLKPEFDYDIAARGFLQAENAAPDVQKMIFMFRRFHDLPYMKHAIEIWTQGDGLINELVQIADELHHENLVGGLSRAREEGYLHRIDTINVLSSPLQQNFSKELAQSARQIRDLLASVMIWAAVLLVGIGLLLSWRISREVRIGIFNLRAAAIKVSEGDLSQRVEVRSHDELGELAVVFNDMIQRRQGAELELRSATEFREKVMQSVTDAIYVTDIEGRFLLVNRQTCAMTGYAESELVGMLFDDLFSNERRTELRKIFEGIVTTGRAVEHYETPLVRKDRQIVTISFSSAALFQEGVIIGLVGAAEDITERKLNEARLEHLANYDALTGLPNRNLLNDRIDQALSRAKRTGTGAALFFLDLDGFKFVNDSLGHGLGDDLLRGFAEKLKASVHADDTVARLGGDEFVILLSDVESEQRVQTIADQILRSFEQLLVIDQRELHVTASIGVSLYPKDALDYATLLQHADIAMYSAKEAGRNCVKFFDKAMATSTHERVDLEAAMREALVKGEFRLAYQPQMDLKTGKFCSAEALMRWSDATFGVVQPPRFIALAEETGLIMPLGEWALRTACRELKAWHEMGYRKMTVAVNVSSRQFQKQGLPQLVRDILLETGVPAASLHLELTESVLLQGSESVFQTLRELKAIGVILALDDFGTGYSSLAYLKRFPVDIIKIDQSFVLDMLADPEAASIIRVILAMAKTLKLKTVAEGVETKEQLDFLQENGCDVIQGYYLSPALSDTSFRKLLAEAS